MSDGSIAVVPTDVVPAAPPVVAAGAIIRCDAKAVADAVRAARLAHAQSRVVVERCRREDLRTIGARLRQPVPDAPSTDPAATPELNLLADRLAAENERLASELATEQLRLNWLIAQLRSLEGRHAALASWAQAVGISVDPVSEPPDGPHWTAVEEAKHRVAAVTRSVAAMEQELRDSGAADERTERRWASTTMPPIGESERDSQSSSERWRASQRQALERALQDAAIVGGLPPEVESAFGRIESVDDESDVRACVEIARAALARRVSHGEVAHATLRRLDDLELAAEASENYIVLAECDAVREDFVVRRRQSDALELDSWAKARLVDIDRLQQDIEQKLAERRVGDAGGQGFTPADEVQ